MLKIFLKILHLGVDNFLQIESTYANCTSTKKFIQVSFMIWQKLALFYVTYIREQTLHYT